MATVQVTKVESDKLPGLYQAANQASLEAQSQFFFALALYLILLVVAAFVSYMRPNDVTGALASASLFLITLGILIFIRLKRPDDIWYNGRAVAESVKTISWRWIMRADPYEDCHSYEVITKQFISDLKSILEQNKSLSHALQSPAAAKDAISQTMKDVRASPWDVRLRTYLSERVQDQVEWYFKKSQFNKRRAKQWFWASVSLHGVAICLLLYKIKDPTLALPIEVIATGAGAASTWLQAKKHNELSSAYALTAHEITLIKGESDSVHSESELSEYVVNSEAAFSREHTQWIARKGDS